MGSVAKIQPDQDQERGQKKKVAIRKSCQNKVCSIFDADLRGIVFFQNFFCIGNFLTFKDYGMTMGLSF